MLTTKSRPKKQVSRTGSVPAPVGGLNARDALANMEETDAVLMDNWFPKTASVDIRNGSNAWATGISGWVETLMYYAAGATKKMFAVASGSIYDVTAAAPVGAASVTGLSNSRFQYVNIGTSAGNYIMAVNGADKLRGFDGTSWWTDGDGTHDITGFNTSTAIAITLWKNRVWMIPNNSFKVWYLGAQSIAGAASSIDLSTLFRLGGYIMAVTPWTIDSYAGVDDYLAFITSEGEVALYKGTDPTSSSTFALQGVFRVGRPTGRRCIVKLGTDIILICSDGIVPLSKDLLSERTDPSQSISYKITNAINADVLAYGSNFGWQAALYPIGTKLIINVPQVENSTQYQYVMNTTTKAWCRFTGWNAACWETMGDNLFYGGNGVVVQADTGTSDQNANITGDVKQAFSYFRSKGKQKRFTMCRPVMITGGQINAAIALNADYEDKAPTSTPSFTGAGGSPWDTSPWDTSPWGGADTIQKRWQTVSGVGYAGALRMQVATKNLTVSWASTDFVYEEGAIL